MAEQIVTDEINEREKLRREREEEERILAQSTAEQEKNNIKSEPENDIEAEDIPTKPKAIKGGLKREDMIIPASIEKNYQQIDGKFYAKGSDRLMFEDTEKKIKTSANDQATVQAMVDYAKAKQWEVLKVSGSKEFRREAYLQAESQGIKTQGYTPTKLDTARLAELTKERAKNTVSQVVEPKSKEAGLDKEQQKETAEVEKSRQTEALAARDNINKNQAELHAEATKDIAANQEVLERNGIDEESARQAAYFRGLLLRETAGHSEGHRDEIIARFDKLAKDKTFVKSLSNKNEAGIDQKVAGRQVERKEPEHSL